MTELVGLGFTVSDARTKQRLQATVHIEGGSDLNFTGGTEGPEGDIGFCFANVGKGAGSITLKKQGYKDRTIEREFPGPTNVDYALEPAAAVWPDAAKIRAFNGAFCIPDALPGIPYGDGRRIWTPAYGCYDDAWRAKIRAAFAQRGYTHFVYNWCGLPYGTDYPELARDSQRARRDLTELLDAGFVPVVALTDDRTGVDLEYALDFIAQCGDLLKHCASFPRWEMNESLGVDVWDGEKWVGEVTRFVSDLSAALAVHAGALVAPYVHFTPNHGSGGDREPEWWQNVTTRPAAWYSPKTGERGNTSIGCCRGNLKQDNRWDDANGTSEGLQTDAMRLNPALGQQARLGWPPVDADVVCFEIQTTALYHLGRSEQAGIDFTSAVFAASHEGYPSLTGVAGFCDSGKG